MESSPSLNFIIILKSIERDNGFVTTRTFPTLIDSTTAAGVFRFTSIIDPIMVVFIGAIVAVIVMSIFQPIFKLSQVGSKG